jgi:phosphonate transport system substrate-binding protein
LVSRSITGGEIKIIEMDSLSKLKRLALPTAVLFVAMVALAMCLQAPAFAGPPDNKNADSSYVLGVYPALPISQMEKIFSPMALEISQAIGRRMHFQSSSTYERYSARVAQGEFDVAFLHPFDYVRYAKKAGYVPIVQKNEDLSAVFVVPQGYPSIYDINDLKGKTIAMPPKGSAVSYLAKSVLVRAGLTPGQDVTLRYFESHSSALQQILIMTADAACSCKAVIRYFESKMKTKLKVIAESKYIPHSLFAVHYRIPKEKMDIITEVLLNTMLLGVPADLRKTFVVGDKKPFIRIADSDMDEVRSYLRDIEKQ